MSDELYFTAVYRGVKTGDEAEEIGKHSKCIAMSWSHALHDRDDALDSVVKHRERIAELEAALAEAQRDAARYRWLRERVGVDVREKYAYFPLRRSQLDNSATDAAIDAAMQEGER